MAWLMSGGELLAGIIALVLWWLTLSFLGRKGNQQITSFQLSVVSPVLLLWLVGGVVLVLRGLTVL